MAQEQYCPICNVPVKPSIRYPRYLCNACAVKAKSKDGRPLKFFNESMSGGYAAEYVDTDVSYPSHECYVNEIECYADESRFGGIVIQAVIK
jgi:hypothetical protein